MNIRNEFPQTNIKINGKRIVYLDSAATSLKPRAVIEKVRRHMAEATANVHRGAHFLSDLATNEYEDVRSEVAKFLNAASPNEIVFTQGTTHGINLIAYSLARFVLKEGDEILVSQMEHHSNIVPWQMIAKEKNAKVRFVPVLDDGTLDCAAFSKMLSARTKLVSLVQLSNALGTWNDLKALLAQAKKFGAYTVVDAAQSVSARKIDVQDLNCDFLVFSGHKVFGPTGVGILYGKESHLNAMPPFLGGGSMITVVDENHSEYLPTPHRFEAGTPPIAEVLGLGEAIRFTRGLDFEELMKHDRDLLSLAQNEVNKLGGFKVFGCDADRSHVFSFLLEGTHPSDVGAMMNEQGIAIRTGHHCCQPLMKRFGISGTARASFSVYSNEEDVRDFVGALKKVKSLLA